MNSLLHKLQTIEKQNRQIIEMLSEKSDVWLSEKAACELTGLSRTSLYNKRSKHPDQWRSRATGRGIEYKASFIENIRKGEIK